MTHNKNLIYSLFLLILLMGSISYANRPNNYFASIVVNKMTGAAGSSYYYGLNPLKNNDNNQYNHVPPPIQKDTYIKKNWGNKSGSDATNSAREEGSLSISGRARSSTTPTSVDKNSGRGSDRAYIAAMSQCKQSSGSSEEQCTEVLQIKNGCGAVAWSPITKQIFTAEQYNVGSTDKTGDKSLRKVEEMALRKCSECEIIASICTPVLTPKCRYVPGKPFIEQECEDDDYGNNYY